MSKHLKKYDLIHEEHIVRTEHVHFLTKIRIIERNLCVCQKEKIHTVGMKCIIIYNYYVSSSVHHISSEKIAQVLGFFPQHTIREAVKI